MGAPLGLSNMAGSVGPTNCRISNGGLGSDGGTELPPSPSAPACARRTNRFFTDHDGMGINLQFSRAARRTAMSLRFDAIPDGEPLHTFPGIAPGMATRL